MVHFSRSLRTFMAVCLALVMLLTLAACTLSASDAPEIDSGEPVLPLPDEGESIFEDQATAVVPTTDETGGGQVQPELPAATATPGQETQADAPAPQQEQAEPAQDIQPTEGPPPATYTLQKGEFPFCIARRFDLNQTELLALNGMTLSSKPAVGTTLKLPQTGNHFVTDRSLRDHPTNYTVGAGETIYTIACKFGDVSPDMIALANGLSEPYSLSSGQALRIP